MVIKLFRRGGTTFSAGGVAHETLLHDGKVTRGPPRDLAAVQQGRCGVLRDEAVPPEAWEISLMSRMDCSAWSG